MRSRPVAGPTQPPAPWVPAILNSAMKRQGCETDHSPPTIATVKKCGSISLLPLTSSWSSSYPVKHRDNSAFYEYVEMFITIELPRLCSIHGNQIICTTFAFLQSYGPYTAHFSKHGFSAMYRYLEGVSVQNSVLMTIYFSVKSGLSLVACEITTCSMYTSILWIAEKFLYVLLLLHPLIPLVQITFIQNQQYTLRKRITQDRELGSSIFI
jgi:hypothetical protein